VKIRNVIPGVFKHITVGISYMIPFVITGGIATAMMFLFKENKTITTFMSSINQYSLTFMWPAVSAGIAYSLAKRTGLVAGCVSGLFATNMNTAFFGAVIGGFIAGYIAVLMDQKLLFKNELIVLKEMIIIPLVSTFITSLFIVVVIQKPIVILNGFFNNFLVAMSSHNPLLLGIVIGIMMIIDLAGPIGKTAYFFGVASLSELSSGAVSTIMSSVMIAGMVPPLALALSISIKPDYFSKEDQQSSTTLWVLGASFITESVIPFVLKDIKNIMPGLLIGCGVASTLSMVLNCGISLPHGGLFILLIPGAVHNMIFFVASLICGVLSSSCIIIFFKGRKIKNEKI
jgi:PTS system fructose-specific IIC component